MPGWGGSRKVSRRFSYLRTPRKIRSQFQGYKHTSLTFLVVKSRMFDLGSQKVRKEPKEMYAPQNSSGIHRVMFSWSGLSIEQGGKMASAEETTNVNQPKGNAAQPDKPWSFYLVVVAILSVTVAFLVIMVLYSRLNIFDQVKSRSFCNFLQAQCLFYRSMSTTSSACGFSRRCSLSSPISR